MKNRVVYVTLALLFSSLFIAGAGAEVQAADKGHDQEKGPDTGKVTVIGEVIDPVCYIRHDSRGEEHRKCAEYCAGLGITLAILQEKNDEVLLAFPVGHSNPNERLMDFIAQKVKVTGTMHEKGGLRGIEVESVEPLAGN